MNYINYAPYYERLRRRRDEIIKTRKHLQKEQRVVDENEEWLDRAAYKSRVDLLDSLADWYAKEIVQVEGALARFAEGQYGICLACHRRIERERLDTAPEASFCASCQSTREALAEM
jgi:RNA polymerase-binding transcription factor DksA